MIQSNGPHLEATLTFVSTVEIAGFSLIVSLANDLSPASVSDAFGSPGSILDSSFFLQTSEVQGSVLAFADAMTVLPVAESTTGRSRPWSVERVSE